MMYILLYNGFSIFRINPGHKVYGSILLWDRGFICGEDSLEVHGEDSLELAGEDSLEVKGEDSLEVKGEDSVEVKDSSDLSGELFIDGGGDFSYGTNVYILV